MEGSSADDLERCHGTTPKCNHVYREAWWWQHHALGLFLFSWNWGLSQVINSCKYQSVMAQTFVLLIEI